MPRPLLFAYGTLREARQRALVLRGTPSRALGTGTVAGALYDLGRYPGLLPGTDPVPGTIIELGDEGALARLDEFEGVAEGLYIRQRTTVRLDGGGAVETWVYRYAQPVIGRRRIRAWTPAVHRSRGRDRGPVIPATRSRSPRRRRAGGTWCSRPTGWRRDSRAAAGSAWRSTRAGRRRSSR